MPASGKRGIWSLLSTPLLGQGRKGKGGGAAARGGGDEEEEEDVFVDAEQGTKDDWVPEPSRLQWRDSSAVRR